MRFGRLLICLGLALLCAAPSLAAGGLSLQFEFPPESLVPKAPEDAPVVSVRPLEPVGVAEDRHWIGFALADQVTQAIPGSPRGRLTLRTANDDALSEFMDQHPDLPDRWPDWIRRTAGAHVNWEKSIFNMTSEAASGSTPAATVVTGTYSIHGDRLHASLEARRGEDRVAQVSAEGPVSDVAVLGERLAERLAKALDLEPPSQRAARAPVRPKNLEAAREYFLARQAADGSVFMMAILTEAAKDPEAAPRDPAAVADGVYARVLPHLERALEQDPEFVAAYEEKASAAIMWLIFGGLTGGEKVPGEAVLGHMDTALEALQRSAELRPESAEPLTMYAALGLWKAMMLRSGALSTANRDDQLYAAWLDVLAALHRATQVEPDSADAHHGLALAYALGAIAADEEAPDKHPLVLDAAIAEQREAVRLGGDRHRGALGLLLALRKHYDQALPELLSVVEANPHDTAIWGAVIGVYYKMERMDDALAAARRAVEANPEDVELQSDLGELLAKTGRTQQAIQVYKTVLDLDPDNEDAKRELERLGGSG